MKKDYHEDRTRYLYFQRNLFVGLTLALAVALILSITLLFWKRERIIIVPATIEKSMWVEGNRVSPTYIEQFGYFLGQLLLNKSSHSAPSQRTILLRHTAPEFASTLNKKLIEEEEMLKKQGASYTFYPVSVSVLPEEKTVILEGDRYFFVGGKRVSSERENYHLTFQQTGTRLMLSGVSSGQGRGA